MTFGKREPFEAQRPCEDEIIDKKLPLTQVGVVRILLDDDSLHSVGEKLGGNLMLTGV